MGQENKGRGSAYRAALAAVILLSALLVAGAILLAIGLLRQYRIFRGVGAGVAAEGAPALLSLAPGVRIVSVQTAPGRLIVHVATPQGGEVEVMDLTSGKLLFRVRSTEP